ncbi:MAG: hypothetical protein QOI98_2702 [Solirubrobacteraceae bacterium]|nr:hypothetical protein [Solirubrobacteraceae bacterium]
MADDEPLTSAERAELETLRARLTELERERSEEIAGAVALAAAAQHRVYWLDRWQVDLNALMSTRRGMALRVLIRLLRWPVRIARRLARQVRG